ncbi:Trk system potassium transporter TrkA [Candidatus Providencia siddallii]|uniref:Trk system potassium uptake protein TrkA n=1 Tax=Candidatus Providencia siddallii TaxID=1715285 RepID=A0ABM9NNR3_9GAMM
MKIIILGAGKVGITLAENLVNKNNDITIVDLNANRLRLLQKQFDLRVVNGYGSHPCVLKDAGAKNTDMLIAVTNSDEVNMIACQIAHSIFSIPKKVARIRSSEYMRESKKLFLYEQIPIDYLISPEQIVIDYIFNVIKYPGALQVVSFAEGKISLVSIKAYYGGYLIGKTLLNLHKHISDVNVYIVAIFRKKKTVKPKGSTVIEVDDEIFFIVSTEHIRIVISEFQRLERSYKRLMIVGGGNIGFGLAKKLEKKYNIKLIEKNKQRAIKLAEFLHNTIIFHGNASDQELLSEEHVEQMDIFIALTDNDEINIMSSMLAKKIGVKKVVSLIQNSAYLGLIKDKTIDIALSPQQATISSLLRHVRKAEIINVFSLKKCAAEVIEAVVDKNKNTSKIINKKISDIKFPEGVIIGAIIKKDEVIIASDNYIIEHNDHLIIFISDKNSVSDIEQIFQFNNFL